MYNFFLHFYREMIKVIYAIFAIAIIDLEMHLNNSNLPIGKNAIFFKAFGLKKGEW